MPPSSASWKQGGALTRNCFGNRFNEQYRRNIDRFPGDFAFQLKPDEWAALRSQIATLNIDGSMRSQFATASKRNIRHLPVVFTEHGALMAANILNSPRAVAMSVYAKPIQFVEVGTPVARCPPHRSRRAVFPHRALRAGTSSSLTGRFARLIRHSYGTGCLCVLRQHVGPFSSFGACALPLDTMDRSDSRRLRRHFLSLRRPSCLALVVSAAGTLRASSVPCVCFGARHALRPRQAGHTLTIPGHLRFGFRDTDPVPACVCCFRGCIA
jgi:hypothetical protein